MQISRTVSPNYNTFIGVKCHCHAHASNPKMIDHCLGYLNLSKVQTVVLSLSRLNIIRNMNLVAKSLWVAFGIVYM